MLRSIDHIVIVVRDLAVAAADYLKAGACAPMANGLPGAQSGLAVASVARRCRS